MKDNGTETRTNVTTNEQALHRDAAVMVAGQSIDSPADLRSRHHGQKYVDNIAMNLSSTKDHSIHQHDCVVFYLDALQSGRK